MFTFEATNDKPLNPGDVAELLTRLAQDSAPHYEEDYLLALITVAAALKLRGQSERYVGEVTP